MRTRLFSTQSQLKMTETRKTHSLKSITGHVINCINVKTCCDESQLKMKFAQSIVCFQKIRVENSCVNIPLNSLYCPRRRTEVTWVRESESRQTWTNPSRRTSLNVDDHGGMNQCESVRCVPVNLRQTTNRADGRKARVKKSAAPLKRLFAHSIVRTRVTLYCRLCNSRLDYSVITIYCRSEHRDHNTCSDTFRSSVLLHLLSY